MKNVNGGRGERFSTVRLALCVFLALAATGALSTASRACGTATHHVIVDMAYNALDKQRYPTLGLMLQAFPGATDGGAVFPDFGYAVPPLAPLGAQYWIDRANDAHDLRFQRPYLEQVRSLFRQPSNDVDRMTVTFLFGLIAHNEADNPWHFGVGSAEGFRDVAMRIDGNTEAEVEFGADSFANVEYGEAGSTENWFFPLDAVLAAYRRIGYEVPPGPVLDGMVVLATLHDLEKAWGYPAYWAYRLDLPWTHDNLLNFPVGGMQDGANHTARAWEQAWDELSTWRYFVPSIRRGSATSPAGGLQDRANPTASVGRQIEGELGATGDAGHPVPRMIPLAQQLLKEGAVRAHTRLENGNLYIDRIEIVDQPRVDELTRQMLAELSKPSSR